MADITFTQTAAADVPTPAAGKSALFFSTTDNSPHYKDSDGNDHALGSGATGTVSSVALTLPAIFVVAGSPITVSGTLSATLANQNANTVLVGPSSGSAAAPTFRALQGGDLPVMGASGSSHAAGAVPDPGATAGTTKYLREDGTWDVPSEGNATEIQGRDVLNTAPTDGQVLTWDSTNNVWGPETPAAGGGMTAGTLTPDSYSDVTWDLAQIQFAMLTLTETVSVANPDNQTAGLYALLIKQDATGGWTPNFGDAYKFFGGATLDTTANATTLIIFASDGTSMFGFQSSSYVPGP